MQYHGYKNVFFRSAVLFLLFFAFSCSPSGYNDSKSLIQWRNLEEGKKEAQATGKPVLIDFFVGVHCMRCEYFEYTLYTDPEIAAAVNRDFIPVRVHLNQARSEDEAALLWTLSPTQECVLAFLDKNGQIVTDETGQPVSSMEMLNKEQYFSYMSKALENIP